MTTKIDGYIYCNRPIPEPGSNERLCGEKWLKRTLEMPKACPYCGWRLAMHKCDQCPKEFHYIADFNDHLEMHRG